MSFPIKWTIPYIDQPVEFWHQINDNWEQYIHSVYLPLPGIDVGSGRPVQPQKNIHAFLNSHILQVSLLVNPVILHNPVDIVGPEILSAIESALKKWRIHEITLTNIDLAGMIKSEFPDLKITASTLLDIFSVQQLSYLDDFDVLVPSTRISRDLGALRKLKDSFPGKIRMMVNEGCLPSCPYRTQHFYEMSCVNLEYPKSLCQTLLKEQKWLRLTGSWVLPQHLHFFDGLYDELKLAGRVSLAAPDKYCKVLEHYIQRKKLGVHEIGAGPAGLHQHIPITEEFYQYTLTCDKNCTACSVCMDYWEKVVHES